MCFSARMAYSKECNYKVSGARSIRSIFVTATIKIAKEVHHIREEN